VARLIRGMPTLTRILSAKGYGANSSMVPNASSQDHRGARVRSGCRHEKAPPDHSGGAFRYGLLVERTAGPLGLTTG
jgi:hypothetical protein